MKKISNNVISGFSFGSTLCYCLSFIVRIYGTITRRLVYIGPDKLYEISWIKDSIIAIGWGALIGICFYEMEKSEKARGKELYIPRIKFKNFATAILFYTTLFFGFLFIFVIREYNEYAAHATYMFRKSFWQYCAVEIPWPEIVITSLIFGVILAIGFSKTPDKAIENKTEKE